MRYKNLLGETIATELSDLKWGEFRCTNCNKVITEKDVIPNDKNQRITTNSINFCSSKCRSENRLTYDRNVRRIGWKIIAYNGGCYTMAGESTHPYFDLRQIIQVQKQL